jgi:hypothetical protein
LIAALTILNRSKQKPTITQNHTSRTQGRRREIGLGSAKIVSVATARKNAHQNLVLVSEGIDPIEYKKQDSVIPTFEVAARKVYEDNRPTWRNAKHAAQFITTATYLCRVSNTGYASSIIEAIVSPATFSLYGTQVTQHTPKYPRPNSHYQPFTTKAFMIIGGFATMVANSIYFDHTWFFYTHCRHERNFN